MIFETRTVYPGTLDETYKGGLYMISLEQVEQTQGDQGVEWLVNEPFDNTDGHMGKSSISGIEIPHKKGQYTHKRYYLSSWLPRIITALLPQDLLYIEEESWNCHPYGLTISTNPKLTQFQLIVESMNLEDPGAQNVFSYTTEEFLTREIKLIDFNENSSSLEVYYKAHPSVSRLSQNWIETTKPISCCYRLTTLHYPLFIYLNKRIPLFLCIFPYLYLESLVSSILKSKQVDLLISHAQKMFIHQDEWKTLTMEDIRKIEEEQMQKVNSLLQKH